MVIVHGLHYLAQDDILLLQHLEPLVLQGQELGQELLVCLVPLLLMPILYFLPVPHVLVGDILCLPDPCWWW